MVDKLQESTIIQDLKEVRFQYLEEDFVMISGVNEDNVQEEMLEEGDGWANMFECIVKWKKGQNFGSRLVWVNIYGIPMKLWNEACLRSVISELGNLVSNNEATQNLDCGDRARVLLKALLITLAKLIKMVKINGHVYQVRVEKEDGAWKNGCKCKD